MPQSLSAVFVHLIFSTKNRGPLLFPRALALDTHSYLAGILSRLGCHPVLINGVTDHVHLLVRLSRTVTQTDHVKELNRASTLWLRKQSPDTSRFSWQAGYGIFSVSVSNLDQVRTYISDQEEHPGKSPSRKSCGFSCRGTNWSGRKTMCGIDGSGAGAHRAVAPWPLCLLRSSCCNTANSVS